MWSQDCPFVALNPTLPCYCSAGENRAQLYYVIFYRKYNIIILNVLLTTIILKK